MRNVRLRRGPPAHAHGVLKKGVHGIQRPALRVTGQNQIPAGRFDRDAVIGDGLRIESRQERSERSGVADQDPGAAQSRAFVRDGEPRAVTKSRWSRSSSAALRSTGVAASGRTITACATPSLASKITDSCAKPHPASAAVSNRYPNGQAPPTHLAIPSLSFILPYSFLSQASGFMMLTTLTARSITSVS